MGFEVRTLEYDADADEVTIEYRRPEGMAPDRGVEVVATLFIAVADRATARSWYYTTVAARDGDIAWSIGREYDLVDAVTGEPTSLVSSVLRHSVRDLEAADA